MELAVRLAVDDGSPALDDNDDIAVDMKSAPANLTDISTALLPPPASISHRHRTAAVAAAAADASAWLSRRLTDSACCHGALL